MTEEEKFVKELLKAAIRTDRSGVEAMQFTQAALNAANAIICMTNNRKLALEVRNQGG